MADREALTAERVATLSRGWDTATHDESEALASELAALRTERDALTARLREVEQEAADRLAELKRERKTPLTESRIWDLVRYCRHELSTAGLITAEEYAHLVSDSTGKPPNSPSARRLEEYDSLRSSLAACREQLPQLQALRPMIDAEILRLEDQQADCEREMDEAAQQWPSAMRVPCQECEQSRQAVALWRLVLSLLDAAPSVKET